MSKPKSKVRKYYYLLATDEKRGFVAGILKLFLLLSSLLYRLAIMFILLGYKVRISRAHKLGCKVISVGNITWGGTGKTPLVQMLAERIARQGRRPAVLIRGYGQDEDRFLEGQLSGIPVLVGRDRVESGRKAVDEHGVDTLILDDGFQHWRISRDLDLLTINSLDPFGNGHLLPRGMLREPLDGLKRANLFLLTKTNLVSKESLARVKEMLTKINPGVPIIESIHQPICLYNLAKKEKEKVGLEAMRNRPVAMLCGIGDPRSFRRTVEALGATIVIDFVFPDHHRYKVKDLEDVIDSCRRFRVETIITTEKDMVRLQDFLGHGSWVMGHGSKAPNTQHPSPNTPGISILALHIQLKITRGEKKLDDLLSGVFSG